MRDAITVFFLLFGSAFMLLASVGVLRMPDLLTRMQAATKASTLGLACMLFAVAVHFNELGVAARVLLVIGFVFLTTPVAAHMLARSALLLGVPLWPGTLREDEQTREPGAGGALLREDSRTSADDCSASPALSTGPRDDR